MGECALTIRRITTLEIPLVIEMARVVWPACFSFLLSAEQIEAMLDSLYAPDALASDMSDKGHVFWVASMDGADVGFASAYLEDEAVWIRKLYVLPDIQKGGVGKALMRKAVEYFADAKRVALYVNRDNQPAIDCYLHMGFAIVDEVPVTMGPFDFIDYIMTKPIG